MRTLNEREKEIVRIISEIPAKLILEDNKMFLKTFFFTIENKRALLIERKSKTINYYMDYNIINDSNKKNKEIYEFLELISLLNYLKENHYIYMVKENQELMTNFFLINSDFHDCVALENKVFINQNKYYINQNDSNIIYNSKDEPIFKGFSISHCYDSIFNDISGVIIPTEELVDIVKNDFKTKEDRKHTLNVRISIGGIVTAIIIALAGIFF